MDVMQAPGADARQVNWVDGRHILKPDSALVRAALDLLATHIADAAAGTSPRCGQCGRYFPCPTVENARQVVVAGGGLLTVAGKRDRKGSAAAVRTAVGDPVARETAVAPVTQKATGGTPTPDPEPAVAPVSGGPRTPAPVEAAPVEVTAVEAAPVEAAPVEVTALETTLVETAPVATAPVETAPVEAAPVETAPGRSVAVEETTDGPVPVEATSAEAAANGPAGTVAAGMVVTVTQIPVPLVKGLPAPRVPDTAAGRRKGRVTGAGDQVVAADPVGAA